MRLPGPGPVAIVLTPFGPGVERLEARCESCGENRVLTSIRKEAGIG